MNPLDGLVLSSDGSIGDAMRILNKHGNGILFITENRKLIGSVTDGDIRRAFLAGATLDSNIKVGMNEKFTSLPLYSDKMLIRKKLNSNLSMIPLCDDYGNIVDVADAQKSHRIPLIEPDLSGRELDYVTDCIQTNWISSQGAYVSEFEQQFALHHPGMHALAVSNGTVALHLALHAAGIKEGDEVIVPNVTFAATINAVLYCNAVPVLCEIDADSYCIDLNEAEKLITDKTKAIVPVHLYGQACDMDTLLEIAYKYQLLIIEDCAEALGTRFHNRPVGTYGDASTFSFFGNKTISTGEGGMVLFKDQEIFESARLLRDHGMSPDKKYWHERLGFNYRLTNIQSAIGLAQIQRIDSILASKIRILKLYSDILSKSKYIYKLPLLQDHIRHTNWLFTILLDPIVDRDSVIQALLKFGIESRPVFYPLHKMPPYRNFKTSSCLDVSNFVSKAGLSLPTSASLSEEEIFYITECLEDALTQSLKSS